jgi:hypothetical protein
LAYKPTQQIFSAHWYGQHWNRQWHVPTNRRSRSIAPNRHDSSQLARFPPIGRQGGKLGQVRRRVDVVAGAREDVADRVGSILT